MKRALTLACAFAVLVIACGLRVLWNRLGSSSLSLDAVIDWEAIAVLSMVLAVLSMEMKPSVARAVRPILPFAPLASVAVLVSDLLVDASSWSFAAFAVFHFAVPILAALTLLIYCFPDAVRKVPHFSLAIGSILAGVMLAQAAINFARFGGVLNRMGFISGNVGHGFGVHTLWLPEFAAVAIGAALGGIVAAVIVDQNDQTKRAAPVDVFLAFEATLVLSSVVLAVRNQCPRCLLEIRDYVILFGILVLVLGYRLFRRLLPGWGSQRWGHS